MSLMKKLLIINNKYRIQGGEDTNIVDELAYLEKYFKIEFLNFDNKGALNLVEIFGLISNSMRESNKKLADSLNRFKPDIVYIHNTWFRANLGLFKILEKRNIQTIVKLHNLRYDCTKSLFSKGHFGKEVFCPKCGLTKKRFQIANNYFKDSKIKSIIMNKYGPKYFKILKNSPIKIIVLNKFHKENLIRLGIPGEKISISYNPIGLNSEITYNKLSNYVVYAGAVIDTKGIKELINAWLNVEKNNLDLLIIGEGEQKSKLEKQYSHKQIKFLGYKENKEVLAYIKKSRAVVTATKMFEGQPRLLCEASSLGVPSIYPSFGGMDEYFPKNYNLSFEQYNYKDLENKIELIQDPNFIEQESLKAYDHINNLLNETKIKDRFDNVIEKNEE